MVQQKDLEEKYILKETIMKDNFQKEKEMDLVNIFGQMAIHILVNGNRMNKMDSENIF